MTKVIYPKYYKNYAYALAHGMRFDTKNTLYGQKMYTLSLYLFYSLKREKAPSKVGYFMDDTLAKLLNLSRNKKGASFHSTWDV